MFRLQAGSDPHADTGGGERTALGAARSANNHHACARVLCGRDFCPVPRWREGRV